MAEGEWEYDGEKEEEGRRRRGEGGGAEERRGGGAEWQRRGRGGEEEGMGGGVMGDGGWLQQLMKYIKQSYIPTLPGFNQGGHSRPTHIAASLYTVYQE